MNNWLEATGLVSLWLVAILRAPAAIEHPRQRALWLGVCLIAVTTTLYQEPVIQPLGRLVGDLNLIDLARCSRTCPQPPGRTFPQFRSLDFTTRSVA